MKLLLLLAGALAAGAAVAFLAGNVRAEALRVSEQAPDFSAPASDGTTFRLSEWLDRAPLVLYFYPKNNTPGCTKEACGLRDDFAAFRKLKAEVFGISYDSIESHRQFIDKYRLPFRLLSDADRRIAKLYGADGLLFARRMTYIVDRSGRIAWVNPAVDPARHSAELQEALARLASRR